MSFSSPNPHGGLACQQSVRPPPGLLTSEISGVPTTWMLRNVQCEHDALTLHTLLSTLVDGASYNFMFLPWVQTKDQNVGFAFVNFLDTKRAEEALAALRGRHWPDSEGKEIEVRPAVVQGFEANMSARRRTDTAWHTRLLLCNGKHVCEETALSLYASRSFAESFIMPPRQQTDETEGDSSSSRSDSLQDMVRTFGVPPMQPKRQPGAAPTSRLSRELLSNHRKLEANGASRQMMMMESEMSTLGVTEGSSTTPSLVPTGSRSGSSHSCTATAAVLESALESAFKSRMGQAAPPVSVSRTALVNGHQWAMPARTPARAPVANVRSMMMTTPSSNASDLSMTMRDSAFNSGSSSGHKLPRGSLAGLVARYPLPRPSQVLIRTRMSF
mmetsp:Transcript_28772/g.85530  ORF Transcript_28772/g.85530 Transcript_28772/m.85530 type:complete len:386 (-) Transcript_28772:133-1290(-)